MGNHRQALEYDLMTKAGRTLADVGEGLSNGALLSFAMNLGGDSATAREIDPDSQWTLVPMLLARISDSLEQLIWMYACAHAGKGRKPKRPRPIPRPGIVGNVDEKHVGKEPIPIEDFEEWYYGGDS